MAYSMENLPPTPCKQKSGAPLSTAASPTGQRRFVVGCMVITIPDKTVFSIDLESPPLNVLKPCKEVDSGVAAWETPKPIVVMPSPGRCAAIPRSYRPIGYYRQNLEQWQSRFPGTFCVFVGNIPHEYDDAALSQALIRMFTVYGVCVAAVHRGREIVTASKSNVTLDLSTDRRMPFAHIQFSDLDSALNAVNQTHGPHELDGRKLRIEFNKAHRSVLVYTADPSLPCIAAVTYHMAQWGRVVSVTPTTAHDQAKGLPIGLRVRFESHLPAQRLQRMVGNGDDEFLYRYKV